MLLLFTAGGAALLLGMSLVLYGAIFHYMAERSSAFMADKIAEASEDMNDPGGIQEEVQDLAEPVKDRTLCWLRILDANGHIVGESRGMPARLATNVFPEAPAAGLRRRRLRNAGGEWISVGAEKVTAQGRIWTIQIAEDRRVDQDFLRELRWILAGVIILGAGSSTLMAGMVATRGLRPVQTMQEAMARVRAARLNERLGRQAWPRELVPVVAAFDNMMDRLEESFTRVSQFSEDLAHEVRTPISNLRVEAEVALSKARSAEEYRQVIESSMEEYERLTVLTRKLLFLAHADAGETQVNREELDVRALLDKVCDLYEPYAEEGGVHLKCEGSGRIKADAILLRQAVMNLIENALRFTPAGEQVTVKVDGAIVSVKDRGCGIDAKHLPRLCDRFYQADPARRKGGTGLGLALVKSIMKLHGGTVTIASEVGRGTEATLTFPSAEV
jgi:two-component system heavy metal sensor histidine kinase CusS